MHAKILVTLIATTFLFLATSLGVATAASDPAKTADHPTVTLETNLGTIVIELFPDKAPKTCENFLRYVREKYYDGLLFHRVIPGFVIQGGGFEPGMKPRPPQHPPIVNEADNGLKNRRGTLSMARTFQVNSATSQFFINLKDNPFLDHQGNNPARFGYAVFGKVIKGMDVVDRIAKVPTTRVRGFKDVPAQDVVIVRAVVNE